ncbi:hypothetical protein O6H91_09G057500 [Diphasiastrum complanatum]|uniref:Uncharacterized protein n=3 Tax=Diphasiastrum complanatum TaxID=34168 RepID=A0ACC2CPJ7_DIPCM|nr:hypothetical protein O6H91_09G057500 [Diphasiastrum complanatum]KAJ7543896.1 hypothetical protein O6H91_09G057500 [Diphasiastrum complanatum]KAJ7543897.1 hypothetical protein O6H91_09G057500 [Diphasiastrum complanatum]
MADLGANWRDRRVDGGATRTGYGVSRSIDDYISHGDRVYNDRGPRADFLGGGSDFLRPGLAYEAGLSSGMSLGPGSGLGFGLAGGRSGSFAGGSLGSLDGSSLRAPGGRVADLDIGLGGGSASSGLKNGIARNPERRQDTLPPDASSTLYVDGLPLDCTRREAAHIFRPFIGFKDLRVLHREGKRSGDKVVLCFVEFADARCAATALQALQDYKFDESDKDSYLLRISFARNPGPRGAARDDDYDRHARRR